VAASPEIPALATANKPPTTNLVVLMSFGGFFVLKIVVLFLMRGWSHVFTIKG
jgi:hypothetical protein